MRFFRRPQNATPRTHLHIIVGLDDEDCYCIVCAFEQLRREMYMHFAAELKHNPVKGDNDPKG